MATLLEKAIASRMEPKIPRKDVSDEHLALGLALVMGKVSMPECAAALGKKSAIYVVYTMIDIIIRLYQHGWIVTTDKAKHE